MTTVVFSFKREYRTYVLTKGGNANFFVGPQIANPQILGLIPQSQIRKFLRCASPQIANPQICYVNPQISLVSSLQIADPQICMGKGKSSIFDPDPH
jgi:hypothetical protein